MNLHEYQSKEILKYFGIKVPRYVIVNNIENSIELSKTLQKETGTKYFIIKAQIHAGGRGISGGIKIAKSLKEVKEKVSKILGKYLITPQTSKEGKLVNKVMIAEDIYYEGKYKIKEYYISLLFDRIKNKNIIIYSNEGGIDIESTAINNSNKIFIEEIDSSIGLQAFQTRKIAFNLKLNGQSFNEFIEFLYSLYRAYIKSDATLLEINPLLKTSDNHIVAIDAKIIIDDNALFRHSDYVAMRDIKEEDPIEAEAYKFGLNFVRLKGNVACVVNGAGLAMATMDMIQLYGLYPANFLDIGGNADIKRIEKAFNILLNDKTVKIIFVNIFGGIVRCDIVSLGIINSCKKHKILKPIVIRFNGTNYNLAINIINNNGLKNIYYAFSLKEAMEKIKFLV
ncbi:MAG: ADP-forming succinate--CoA ligase subunit beta [Candidatus Bostrichicola ureolyticus]|nr:MAG: ADP-forming succinate--CoA ligase subunit beta [Candidatus Bostrichicola ureolyticus]